MKLKKVMAITLGLIMGLSMAACKSKTETVTTAAQTSVSQAETTKSDTSAADMAAVDTTAGMEYQPMALIIANAGQDGDSLDSAQDYFLEEMGKATNGAVTGEVHPNSQLGSHSDYIGSLQMQSIQIAEATAAVLSTVSPKFAIFDLPYVAPNSAQSVFDLLEGEAGEILNQDLIDHANIRVIGWMCRTPRHVYSAKGPINTLDDWKGLKIRTMESSAMISAMELLNAKATPIATAERYLALQTGVVDAAENNVAEIYNCKEFEVTKYLSKTGHLCAPNVLIVSNSWFESLTPEYQELVLRIGRDAGKVATDIEISKEADFEEKLVGEGGMTINEITDTSDVQAALAPLYEEYKDIVGEDLLKLFQEG
ncbi:MAG: DctP family TRAP transporter solute-binding subunit [Clostridiaceae bacterium]|nr:DctP family TRAP transporter solute-binding subunit [Clostridiaceae bacterium]